MPFTPLGGGEPRAPEWLERMGVEQTEVDALAALQPGTLRGLARDAMRQFIDATLDARVRRARAAWEDAAQAAIDAAVGDEMTTLAATLTEHLAAARRAAEAMERGVHGVALPPVVIPTAEEPPPPVEQPLIDSAWPFVRATHRSRTIAPTTTCPATSLTTNVHREPLEASPRPGAVPVHRCDEHRRGYG